MTGASSLAMQHVNRPAGVPRRLRVLIADDSKSYRHQLGYLVTSESGAEVVGMARDGSEAVALAARLKPDVILMDQRMPRLTGLEATARIKARDEGVRIFFVVGDPSLRKAAQSAGAEAFFTKDGDLEPLLRLLRSTRPGQTMRARPPTQSQAPGWAFSIAPILLGVLVFGLVAFGLRLATRVSPVSLVALAFGLFFFLYALKYYLSIALLLWASGGNGNGHNGNGAKTPLSGNGRDGIRGLAHGNGHNGKNGHRGANGSSGLVNIPEGSLTLARQPFVSIHLPLYNEKEVVDRLLTACTSFQYDNYEVIVADDSTDETTAILRRRWGRNPRVKISHREDRAGFKGGALAAALQQTDPRAEFVVVFDADFVPPPGILQQFLAYFYGSNGKNGNQGDHEAALLDDRVAVVQGYQWHILNASENWITRGVRTEFSGSYVVERPAQELLGSMKMIAGSVFMIRADVLRSYGWSTSITEDWELTCRLYRDGYRVLYTPFAQAPAECVSSFTQLARQRMRWAEGHTYNVKKHFGEILRSTYLSTREKLEFLYYASYYLQSVIFAVGTACWLVSELILRVRLPFWSATLGWGLVFTNFLSLGLMNLVGLFLERGVRRNWSGLLSFALLTYLLVPYQAYAALKGLLEKQEGGWHRTHKTGVVTEVLDRLGLRRMRRLMPRPKLSPARVQSQSGGKGDRRIPGFRRALGSRLAFGLALVLTLAAMLWVGLPMVSAQTDAIYLHEATVDQVAPAGRVMSAAIGGGGSEVALERVGQEETWYLGETWPESTRLGAGEYTLHLFFASLPSPWWDERFPYRRQLSITAGKQELGPGAPVVMTFDHAAMVSAGKSLPGGDDIRMLHWDGAKWTELDRVLLGGSEWNRPDTSLWFAVQEPLGTWSSDSSYFLYYGAPEAGAPPADGSKVFALATDYKEATLQLGEEATSAGIRLNVNLAHTAADGSDGREIVSRDLVIDGQTPNPFVISIGRGAEWEIGTGDPRRLRLTLRVEQMDPGARAVLAYDSLSKPSSLETPAIPDVSWGTALLLILPLVPFPMALVWRKQRVVWHLLTVLLAIGVMLGVGASRAEATVSDTSTTFWFWNASWPPQYEMVQTQPSGTAIGTTASISFYSDTWQSGWQLSAGTSTVYMNLSTPAWGFCPPTQTITLTLIGGSTTLGTSNWTVNRGLPTQLLSHSFSTNGYTFADGERLRLNVTLAGGFCGPTVYWDGQYNTSRLVVPTISVPENVIWLAGLAVLIPATVIRFRRHRRLPGTLISIFLAGLLVLGHFAAYVPSAEASPDVFYQHDTATTGITPAGKTMNTTLGTGASTIAFGTAGQDAYWYADQTWPTGGDDGGIAAGNYTLNMYFSQLPKPWWNSNYAYRQQITISAGGTAVPSGYSTSISFNHAALVGASKSLASGNDIRIVYWNGSGWTELDRMLDDGSSWNSTTTQVWFRTQAAIGASSSDANYYMYYGNTGAGSPPSTWSNVFLFYDDFGDGSFDTGRWTCTRGTCTESGGTLTLGANSSVWATAGYAIGVNTRWEARVRLSSSTIVYFNYWGASDTDDYANDYITFWTDATNHFVENAVGGTHTNATFAASTPTSFHVYAFNREGSSNVRYFQDATQVGNLTTNVPTSNLRVFNWNDNATDSQTYDWVRVRRYVSPEPTTSLGAEASGANVQIIVTVSHTAPDGSGATTIVSSSTTTIDANTPNPYALSVGSGAQQTFTSANPRLLRVQINVAAVNGGERFILAYDSSSNPSNLATPAVTVPENSMWGAAAVVLIPVIAGGLWRRRLRRAGTGCRHPIGD